jgi:hypothetical protein
MSTPPTTYYPANRPEQHQPSRRQWRIGWLLVGLVGSLLLIAGLVLGGMAYLFVQGDRIFPGVAVYGVPVGGLTPSEAALALTDRWQRQVVDLVVADAAGETTAVWTVPPSELGMMIDGLASAQRAYEIGRSWPSLVNWWQHEQQIDLPPVWRFDRYLPEQYLNRRAAELTLPPVDASLHLIHDGDNAPRVEAVSSQMGQQLDVAATLEPLLDNPGGVLLVGQLPLVIVPLTPTLTDVSATVAQANDWLAQSLTITAYDPIRDEQLAWEIGPAQWGRWGRLTVDPATLTLDWVLAETAVLHHFDEILAESNRFLPPDELVTAVDHALDNPPSPVNLRLFHREQQHIVQSGESFAIIGRMHGIPYPWIQEANPGVEILHPGQTITIPSPDELLPLPVVENKRILVSLSEQRVRVYENGSLKWDWITSTGIDDSPTAPGIFQIQSHEPNAYAANWDLWMPHFMGVYRPVPTSPFMNGFHGFPTQGGSQILWTNSLGRRVTYGCILLSNENAIVLYEWAEPGVVVEIQ